LNSISFFFVLNTSLLSPAASSSSLYPQDEKEIRSRGLLRMRREKREGKGEVSGAAVDERKQI